MAWKCQPCPAFVTSPDSWMVEEMLELTVISWFHREIYHMLLVQPTRSWWLWAEMICNGPISLSRQVWVVDFGLELLNSIRWRKICKSILWNGWVSGLASTHATFFGDFPETIKAKWTTGWMRRVDWEILVGCLMDDNYVFTKKPLDRVNFPVRFWWKASNFSSTTVDN